ncbi:GNAT family N-acetyltransferase [Cytobacillus horneckiae]|uniref:hypothetical protein n=1 Tax=Cytobacillus horneckiae TaxID=549687 RepID=UPI0034CEF4F3
MLYNLKADKWVECFYRRVEGINEINEFSPPKWRFEFLADYQEGYEIFALETKEYQGIAQGIVALKVVQEEYAVHLKSAETADSNKYYIRGEKRNGVNKDRIYKGVGTNLVAFACQYSLENKYDGFMYLISKTTTIPFYEKFGGEMLSKNSQTIFFDEKNGGNMARKYFQGGAIKWVEQKF